MEYLELPKRRRKPSGYLEIVGASEHNLRDVDAHFALGALTCVTGVSGSGKSTLVNDILYASLANKINGAKLPPGRHKRVVGVDQQRQVEGAVDAVGLPGKFAQGNQDQVGRAEHRQRRG